MSYSVNNQGQYIVQFNGSVIDCRFDGDCPGESVCISNQTWTAFPSMCTCSVALSRIGEDCKDHLPVGFVLLALYLVALVLSNFAAMILSKDAYILYRAGVKFSFSALQSTILFLLLGAIALCTYQLIGILDFFGPLVLVPRGNGEIKKSSPVYYLSNIFLAVTFFFVTLGLLNISLVWIEVAEATKRMSHRIQHNIVRFRKTLFWYYLIFGGALIVLLAIDLVAYVNYIAIPPILFLLVSYIWGYIKMVGAAKAKSSGKSADGGGETSLTTNLTMNTGNTRHQANDELKNALRAMAKTAFYIVLFGILGVACLILQAVFQNANTPDLPLNNIFNRLGWICWSSCELIGAIYLHFLVKRNASRATNKRKFLDSKKPRRNCNSSKFFTCSTSVEEKE